MSMRELFTAALKGQADGQFPVMEFMGFWPDTERRWRQEGPVGNDLFAHFELIQQDVIPIDFNFIPAFDEIVLEEDERFQVMQDAVGCIKKIEKNTSSMPHYIEFPIKDRKSFESVRERMNPSDPARYPSGWPHQVEHYKKRTTPLGLVIRGPFAFCRDFIDFEQMMMLVYDDPELIRDMMAFQVEFTIQLWQDVLSRVDVDFVYLGEDMAYKNGPMFAPDYCKTVIAPLYHKLADFFRGHGVEILILDSDGNVMPLVQMYLDCGMTCILPLERAAGMDPVTVRQRWPKLQMIGGVDKLNIARGKEGVDEEIGRIKTTLKAGGWIPSFDHSVPPIVAYETYAYYNEKLKRIARG